MVVFYSETPKQTLRDREQTPNPKLGIFFVFAKGLRAQRAGRVAPRRGGAKRRAAALGAAQRRKAPPQAAERRAAHKACFSAFNFRPIIEKQKMLTGTSAEIRPIMRPRQSLGTESHVYHVVYLIYTCVCTSSYLYLATVRTTLILQASARASKSILLRSAWSSRPLSLPSS